MTNIYQWQTQYTRQVFEGKRIPQINMWNGKPFRTRAQKLLARKNCRRGEDGSYYSSEQVSYHPAPRGQSQSVQS